MPLGRVQSTATASLKNFAHIECILLCLFQGISCGAVLLVQSYDYVATLSHQQEMVNIEFIAIEVCSSVRKNNQAPPCICHRRRMISMQTIHNNFCVYCVALLSAIASVISNAMR